jgi:amino acid transporter
MYSVLNLSLGGPHPNALIFGQSVLIASTKKGTPVEPRLQKFFSILLVGLICQLQAVSRINYVRFSNIFAIYKVLFLSFITIAGWHSLASGTASTASQPSSGKESWGQSFQGMTKSPYNTAMALLAILRAYSGWENANFVSGSPQRSPVFLCMQS